MSGERWIEYIAMMNETGYLSGVNAVKGNMLGKNDLDIVIRRMNGLEVVIRSKGRK